MAENTEEAKKSKRVRKVESKNKSTQIRYPGLKDNLIKLFNDNPTTRFAPVAIQREHFPEVPYSSVAYNLNALAKKRILRRATDGYILAGPSHRNLEAPLETVRIAKPVKAQIEKPTERAGHPDSPADEFTQLFLKRIEARLQEAHDLDIAFLRKLAQ